MFSGWRKGANQGKHFFVLIDLPISFPNSDLHFVSMNEMFKCEFSSEHSCNVFISVVK